MHAIGMKVLKNKLSEYVRLVASGETVLVTGRDRVVAELRPRERRSPVQADALLAEAVRHGWVSPPLVTGGEPPPRSPVASFAELWAELDQDRAAR